MPTRIAINGFGRIGRNALKIALGKSGLEVVAINDLTSPSVLAHLLKYDSVYGTFSKEIQVEENGKIVETEGVTLEENHFQSLSAGENYLIIDGRRVRVLSEKEPGLLPWRELKVAVVLECTGRLTKNDSAQVHLKAGARRVIGSAPTKGGQAKTFLLGVNEKDYRGESLVSNASCTSNCISPIASLIEAKFGVVKALITTIHAYTAEQNLVDGVPPQLHTDLRRARAAAHNIVPTTTGAASAVGEVLPQLKGIFDGLAIRVPVICGSLSDFTFLVKKKTTIEEVNQVFLEAKKDPPYKGIVDVTYEPLVSGDIVGSPYSAIVDLSLTKVVDGDLVKVVAWYDNEWGYVNRLVEMAELVGKSSN